MPSCCGKAAGLPAAPPAGCKGLRHCGDVRQDGSMKIEGHILTAADYVRVSTEAATFLRIDDPRGQTQPGARADLVAQTEGNSSIAISGGLVAPFPRPRISWHKRPRHCASSLARASSRPGLSPARVPAARAIGRPGGLTAPSPATAVRTPFEPLRLATGLWADRRQAASPRRRLPRRFIHDLALPTLARQQLRRRGSHGLRGARRSSSDRLRPSWAVAQRDHGLTCSVLNPHQFAEAGVAVRHLDPGQTRHFQKAIPTS